MAKRLYVVLLLSVVLSGSAFAQISGTAGASLANPYGAVALPGTTTPPKLLLDRAVPRQAPLRVRVPALAPLLLRWLSPRRRYPDNRGQAARRGRARLQARIVCPRGCCARLREHREWCRFWQGPIFPARLSCSARQHPPSPRDWVGESGVPYRRKG